MWHTLTHFQSIIQVISGQYVCPDSNAGSPVVEVELIGIPVDCNKQRTRVVQRNSLNPIFNDSFVFRVRIFSCLFNSLLPSLFPFLPILSITSEAQVSSRTSLPAEFYCTSSIISFLLLSLPICQWSRCPFNRSIVSSPLLLLSLPAARILSPSSHFLPVFSFLIFGCRYVTYLVGAGSSISLWEAPNDRI